MSPGDSRRCTACERSLPATSVYFRFAVAIEAELDVLDTGPHASDPRAALAELERARLSGADAEAEVHWEASGVLCATCRTTLMERLGGTRLSH